MNASEGLNAEQRAAVEAGEGPVVIIAGPGTGKTKTLIARVAYLIATKRTTPEQILALTFTKKAAQEMQERMQDGRQATSGLQVMTFHALCYSLLGGEGRFISEPARLQLIKKLPKPADLKGISTRELGLFLSLAKNMANDQPAVARLLKSYNAELKRQELMDFDDLLVNTKELLETDVQKRKELQSRYTHILVDEFQDTNRLQYELLLLLRGNDNMFVIGDPQQSIYGFRGASGGIFAQFIQDFPAATAVTLTTNYRSNPEIVNLANDIFPQEPNLRAHSLQHGSVQAMQVLNEYSEANWIVSEIQRAIGGGDMQRAVSNDERASQRTLKDFAILYRNRSVAGAVQKAVAASGLPYQIAGDGSPYDTPELQALIALLKTAVTGERAQLEGFTAAEVTAVQNLLGQAGNSVPKRVAEKLIHILGLEVKPELQQFVNTLVGHENVGVAVEYFERIGEQGYYDPNADAVTLLTIHASKGLEFSHVFLVGAEEGTLPSARADAAEERRLFYVAATRAKERLHILHAKHRGGEVRSLSGFAVELSDAVLPKRIDPNIRTDQRRAQLRAIKRSQQSLF